jgi:hypothetical protein
VTNIVPIIKVGQRWYAMWYRAKRGGGPNPPDPIFGHDHGQ